MTRKNLERQAAAVWTRTGRPHHDLRTMTDAELETLLTLHEADGAPVAGFREKIAAFIDEYYDSRKASVEPTPLPEPLSESEADSVDHQLPD